MVNPYWITDTSFVSFSRSLREKWEGFSDDLSDTQRDLEVSALQWSSYDESVNAFLKWIGDAEAKLKLDSDPKATLQEKKVQLHSHKVKIYLNLRCDAMDGILVIYTYYSF